VQFQVQVAVMVVSEQGRLAPVTMAIKSSSRIILTRGRLASTLYTLKRITEHNHYHPSLNSQLTRVSTSAMHFYSPLCSFLFALSPAAFPTACGENPGKIVVNYNRQ